MPLIDLRAVPSADGSDSALEACDVCIVGTGPAGSTIAAELAQTGLRVTILESGDFVRRPEVDELTEVESVGAARNPNQWAVRNRIVGGSSHTWGGRGAPFDEIDFEERSWVPESGWPYPREEIAPYLQRSAPYLGLAFGDGFSDERFWDFAGQARLDVAPDPSLIRPFYWQFSRDPHESYPFEYMRFGRDFVNRLGPRQTLVTGAHVIRVVPVESGRAVQSVVFADTHGRERVLAAGVVVLCTGGIENARILLSSDTVTAAGLGNDHDNVGRYLMDHPRGAVASFDVATSRALQTKLLRFNVRNRLFRAGFRLSPEVQRAEGLVNTAAWLHEIIAPDDPWDAIRRMVRGGSSRPQAMAQFARGGALIARGVPDYYIRRIGVPRKLAELQLLAMCEQVPDPESRVTLGEKVDRFGVRIPRIDWRIHPDEARSVRRTAELVTEELERMGFPPAQLSEWVVAGEQFPAEFRDVAHPTGTTKMSDDPMHGVVDRVGMVHGVDGLYVAGSSTFPTAGHCNPTQMIVALAIRTADSIRGREVAPKAPVAAADSARTTVLVTGATGRIGRVLVPELLRRGYAVRATTSAIPAAHQGEGVDWAQLDLASADSEAMDAVVHGCTAVVHLAAALGGKERMPRVNTEATRLLAEAAEAAGVSAFCYTSTVSVYGSSAERTVTEASPVLTHERDVASEYLALDYVRAYGRTKLLGELAIRDLARRVKYVVLRPTVVVSAEQIVDVRSWSTSKRYLGAHRTTQHVYVGDVVDAIIWSIERGMHDPNVPEGSVETFNLADDEPRDKRYIDFMRDAYAVSGDARYKVPPVPGVLDWAQDLVRFRTISTRNPLWRMRFSSERIRAAGWRPRFGIAYARGEALETLRAERNAHDSSPSSP